jgi:hypothetical protein
MFPKNKWTKVDTETTVDPNNPRLLHIKETVTYLKGHLLAGQTDTCQYSKYLHPKGPHYGHWKSFEKYIPKTMKLIPGSRKYQILEALALGPCTMLNLQNRMSCLNWTNPEGRRIFLETTPAVRCRWHFVNGEVVTEPKYKAYSEALEAASGEFINYPDIPGQGFGLTEDNLYREFYKLWYHGYTTKEGLIASLTEKGKQLLSLNQKS